MRINILIGGDAGQGINELANITSRALVKAGFGLFNYRDYRSLITGGHNFNVISISTDEEILSHELEYDIVLAMDSDTFTLHKENFKESAVIIHNQKEHEKDKNSIFLNIDSKYKKVENMFYASALFKILGIKKEILEEEVRKTFSGKPILDLDLEAINKSHSINYNKNLNIKPDNKNKKKVYLTGAEATGIGAIESGLDVYFAYPMTPATSLLTFLAQNQQKHSYFVFSPESEVAVANAALGASYAGARAMLGSSGGGFDLMTEAISMQGQAELPLVAYLASRSGPSSGTPTYTGQDDLNLALNAGHGEFPRIVIAPGDIQEAYQAAKQAFYLAEKYNSLAIILTDKHHAESGFSQELKPYNLYIEKKNDYPMSNPKIAVVKKNSYSHDKFGNYTESAEIIKEMTDNRNQKLESIKKEIEKLKIESFKSYGDKNAKKLIIGFGSTKGAILDAIKPSKELSQKFRYLHVIYINPISESLINEIKKFNEKDIFVIENNSTGQFAEVIQKSAVKLIKKENRLLKYDGRPFTPSEITNMLNKIK